MSTSPPLTYLPPTQTLSATSSVLPRTVIGPLPTDYSYDPDCNQVLAAIASFTFGTNLYRQVAWGATCGDVYRSSCFPAGLFETNALNIYEPSITQLAVYSPASQCPSGWSVACSASKDSNAPLSDSATFLTSWISDGEIIQVCCPSDWVCELDDILLPRIGTRFLNCRHVTTYSRTGFTCFSNNDGSFTATSQLSQDIFDQELFANVAPGLALVTGNGTTPSPTGLPLTIQNNDSLSIAAKVGLAVGILLAVIIMVTLMLAYLRRRRNWRLHQRVSYRSWRHKLELPTDANDPAHERDSALIDFPSEVQGSATAWELADTSPRPELLDRKISKGEKPPVELGGFVKLELDLGAGLGVGSPPLVSPSSEQSMATPGKMAKEFDDKQST